MLVLIDMSIRDIVTGGYWRKVVVEAKRESRSDNGLEVQQTEMHF